MKRNTPMVAHEGTQAPRSLPPYARTTICALIVAHFTATLLTGCGGALGTDKKNECLGNLTQIGAALATFAPKNKWRYPELNPESGRLMFINAGSYTDDLVFTSDGPPPEALVCPGDGDKAALKKHVSSANIDVLLDDNSYFYIGYLVMNEEEMASFADAYKARAAKGLRFDIDLDPKKLKGLTIPRRAFESDDAFRGLFHYLVRLHNASQEKG